MTEAPADAPPSDQPLTAALAALHEARAEAADRASLLQVMLDTMRHGIALFGPDQRLVMANAMAAGLAGLHPGELRPGLTPGEIALIQRERGAFGSGPAAAEEAARLGRLDRTRPHRIRRIMPDGRVIDSVSDATPDGGCVITWTDVTATVRAEEAAERRAATLQAMIENMRHGVALFGADRRLMAANRLLQDLAGFPEGALRQGRRLDDLVDEQFAGDPAPERAHATLALEADLSRPLRHIRPAPDGRLLEVTSDPMPDGGFVIGITDITALARAEAEARQRAQVQAVMLDTIRHGIALYGPDHRMIAVNRLSGTINGMPGRQFGLGTPYEEVVRYQADTGGLGPDPAAEVARLLALDRRQPHHYHRRTGDGRLIEVHSDPTPDGGFAITFSDITVQAAAEAAAASRATMLQAALDAMRHGILLFGPDRRLLASNALVGEVACLDAEELRPGMLVDDILRHQHARGMYGSGPEADATLRRLIEADRSKPWQRCRQMPDGREVEVVASPTPDGGFVVTFTDVTARARAETEARHRANTLRVTLDSTRHAIAMYGPDRRLVVANRLAGPAYSLPELEDRTGALFDDLVREQQARGMFGPEPEAGRVAADMLSLDRSKPLSYQRRTASGLVLEIGSDPTPDGGFVITITDVTALEAAKAEASTRADVLQVMLDNIGHGIRYFGPDQRLIARNELVDDLTGTTRLGLGLGVSYAELLERQAAEGCFGNAEETARMLRLGRTLNQGVPVRYVRRTPHGRILEISSVPAPDGGFIIAHTDATELLQAQTAAADRAVLLQVMLDSMRHGIALFDRDRRLVAANALAAEFNGLDADAFRVGRPLAELLKDAVALGVRTPEDAEASVQDDYKLPRRRTRQMPGGRVIEICIDPTPDGGFVSTYTDVTALTLAEAAATERAGVLQVMLDNIRHGICYYGPDGRVIAANALASEFGGHPPGTLRPGRSLDELIVDQLAAGALGGDAAATAAMARSLDRSRPARYVRPAANGRILEVTSDPTPDGGFVVTSSDITALADAEQAARHRAAILQAMLDNSRQGIILFDAEGRVVAANGMAADLNGLPAETLQPGQSVQALIEHQTTLGYFDAEQRADALALVPQDRPWPVPAVRQRKFSRGRTIEVTTDRVGEAGYIRSYRDISDEQRARAELERARDAAEAANMAKSRFLATMSHELRTPLNAVIGFSEAFMVDSDPGRRQDYVRSIHEAGRHLLSLIDDILDVTRSETTGFAITESPVDMVVLAEGAVRVMQATAATAQVAVRAALPVRLPLVRADELRLRQVLLNLLSNAVKFTPAGGSVSIGAEVEPAGGMVVRITDTGIGMRPEDIPRMFEAFTQLDSSLSRRFPGSGLGLYLSRALAEAQGASLTLESAPGAGTTAVLRFPQSRLLAELAA